MFLALQVIRLPPPKIKYLDVDHMLVRESAHDGANDAHDMANLCGNMICNRVFNLCFRVRIIMSCPQLGAGRHLSSGTGTCYLRRAKVENIASAEGKGFMEGRARDR